MKKLWSNTVIGKDRVADIKSTTVKSCPNISVVTTGVPKKMRPLLELTSTAVSLEITNKDFRIFRKMDVYIGRE